MSKPIVFQPGDVLTAEQINNYLLENDEAKLAALNSQLSPIWGEIKTSLSNLDKALKAYEIYTTGGRPVYDYENI